MSKEGSVAFICKVLDPVVGCTCPGTCLKVVSTIRRIYLSVIKLKGFKEFKQISYIYIYIKPIVVHIIRISSRI